jgi:hypothetical protein
MDGIFVAYHNTKRIFGFQYISLDEMDAAIHGNPEVGKQEFHFSIKLFNETLNRAVQQFPEKVRPAPPFSLTVVSAVDFRDEGYKGAADVHLCGTV